MSFKEIKNNKEEKNLKASQDQEVDEGVDDIIIEPEEETANSFGDKITKDLREKLKKITAEKQEYLAGWQRAKADSINVQKDFKEEKSKLLKFAKADLIVQLIPVLDSFEMALKNVDKSDEKLKEWSQGVQYIYSQLFSILENNGVKQIDPLNEEFNPEFHISIESVKVDEEKFENIIVEVVQKGYFLNEKVIREAKVKVGEYEEKSSKVQNPNFSK